MESALREPLAGFIKSRSQKLIHGTDPLGQPNDLRISRRRSRRRPHQLTFLYPAWRSVPPAQRLAPVRPVGSMRWLGGEPAPSPRARGLCSTHHRAVIAHATGVAQKMDEFGHDTHESSPPIRERRNYLCRPRQWRAGGDCLSGTDTKLAAARRLPRRPRLIRWAARPSGGTSVRGRRCRRGMEPRSLGGEARAGHPPSRTERWSCRPLPGIR